MLVTSTTILTEMNMTLCPIAIVAGCKKCPVFSVCPLKGVIGDQGKDADTKAAPPPAASGKQRKKTR